MLAFLVGTCAWGRVDLAAALELRYGAGYTGTYTSNALLTPTDRKADWINLSAINFRLADSPETFEEREGRVLSVLSRGRDLAGTAGYLDEARRRMSPVLARGFSEKKIVTDVSAEAAYENYGGGTREDELLLGLDAYSTFMVRPGWFSWTVEDVFGQAPIDRTAAITPDNRQNFNLFGTGPNFTFRLAPEHTVALEARYQRNMYQDSPLDDNRYRGALRWVYGWSPSTLVSANIRATNVDFTDAALRNDYDRLDYFIDVAARRFRFDLSLNGGWSQVYREVGPTLSKPTGSLALSYFLTSESRVGASTLATFTDTVETLAGITAGVPVSPIDTVSLPVDTVSFIGAATVSDVIYRKAIEIFYERAGPSGGGRLLFSVVEQDYSVSPLDERDVGGSLELEYRLSALWGATLAAGYQVRDFLETVQTDHNSEVGIGLSYRAQQYLTLSFGVGWSETTSTDPTAEFEEIRGGLTISYER